MNDRESPRTEEETPPESGAARESKSRRGGDPSPNLERAVPPSPEEQR